MCKVFLGALINVRISWSFYILLLSRCSRDGKSNTIHRTAKAVLLVTVFDWPNRARSAAPATAYRRGCRRPPPQVPEAERQREHVAH